MHYMLNYDTAYHFNYLNKFHTNTFNSNVRDDRIFSIFSIGSITHLYTVRCQFAQQIPFHSFTQINDYFLFVLLRTILHLFQYIFFFSSLFLYNVRGKFLCMCELTIEEYCANCLIVLVDGCCCCVVVFCAENKSVDE